MIVPLTRLVIAVSFLNFLSACAPEPVYQGQVAQNAVGNIRLFSGAKIPAAAKNVWLYEINEPQHVQLVRFDVDGSVATAFSSTLLHVDLQSDYESGVQLVGPKLPWWPRVFPVGAKGMERRFDDYSIRVAILYKGKSARVWIASYEHL
jgi:hypothetical protein